MTEDQVRALILQRCKPYAKYQDSSGMTGWAAAHGISSGHLSNFMRGRRAPSQKILDALNLEYRIVRKQTPPLVEELGPDGGVG